MNRTKIEPPKEIFASLGDDLGQVNLQWDSVDGATGYIIQQAYNRECKIWRYVDIVNESRYKIEGLSLKKKYVFRVAAMNRNGHGNWSKEINKNL